jgi:hypothetical protein
MTQRDRKAGVVRAGKLRAAIRAALNAPGTRMSAADLVKLPLVKALKYKSSQLQQIAQRMVDSGELTKDEGPSKVFLYSKKRGSRLVVREIEGEQPEPNKRRMLRVDFVKATGRVRFELGGVLIEIGVV